MADIDGPNKLYSTIGIIQIPMLMGICVFVAHGIQNAWPMLLQMRRHVYTYIYIGRECNRCSRRYEHFHSSCSICNPLTKTTQLVYIYSYYSWEFVMKKLILAVELTKFGWISLFLVKPQNMRSKSHFRGCWNLPAVRISVAIGNPHEKSTSFRLVFVRKTRQFKKKSTLHITHFTVIIIKNDQMYPIPFEQIMKITRKPHPE